MRASHPYRPDIDGLRAIAILSVVAFHAFPTLVHGGFVGVDVFFVISGYLITSVIVTGLRNDRFSFLVFYRNRIRRIFPALAIVLFSSAVAGWFLLSEREYAALGKHIAGGAGFVANFVLWKESGYFDNASDLKPLLHLWSLGIEEQFYLVWPCVIWLAWRRRWNLFVVTALLIAASFLLNVVTLRIDAVANFYSPATRIWELLIGAALAGAAPPEVFSNGGRRSANLLAFAGLAAILLAGGLLTRNSAFPGWWALLPTLGTAAIIAAGPDAWLNRSVLSRRSMVWVGLISYPLYLWHWPILSFLRITGAVGDELALGTVAIGAAFALSWLTYRLVERPLRSSRDDSPRPGRSGRRAGPALKANGLLISMTSAALLGGFIHQANGHVYRPRAQIASLPPLPDKSVFEALKTYEHYDKPNTSCRDKLNLSPFPEEVCITNSREPKVLFLGDSHAMGLYSALFADHVKVPSVLIASPGCLTYSNLTYRPNGKEWGQNCGDIAKQGLDYAKESPSVRTVVISLVRKGDHPDSPTNFYSGDRRLTEREVLDSGTDHLVRSLLETGKDVVFVVDVPYFQNTPETCQSKFLVSQTDPCVFDKAAMNVPFKIYFDALERIRKRHPRLKVFNAEDVLCKADTCAQHDGRQYFYIDKDHLSVYGSENVLAKLFERFPVN